VFLPEPAEYPYWRSGPKSDRHLASESRRLERIYQSIRNRGFFPGIDGLPTFFLLLRDEGAAEVDFRVVITHGNHRLVALSALGWESVPMTPGPTILSGEIRLSDIEQWPGVVSGELSTDEARRLFLAFFRNPNEEFYKQP